MRWNINAAAAIPMAFIAEGEILACCCVLESDVAVVCRLREDGERDKGG